MWHQSKHYKTVDLIPCGSLSIIPIGLSKWPRIPMVTSWVMSCPRVQASRCLVTLQRMLKATRLAIRLLPTQALSSSLVPILAWPCFLVKSIKCCNWKKYDTILVYAHSQGCASLASRKMLALSLCCRSFSKYAAERSIIPRLFWTVFSDAYIYCGWTAGSSGYISLTDFNGTRGRTSLPAWRRTKPVSVGPSVHSCKVSSCFVSPMKCQFQIHGEWWIDVIRVCHPRHAKQIQIQVNYMQDIYKKLEGFQAECAVTRTARRQGSFYVRYASLKVVWVNFS